MATVMEIYNAVDCFAPFSTQMGFDNSGLLVGRAEAEVTKILVALDITLPVIQEAVDVGAQLILSHHPVIFHPVKSILEGDPTGDKLIALIRHGIAAICAHTNLDIAVGGVNDKLAEALELNKCEVFLPDGINCEGRPFGLGRIGLTNDPYSLPEFAEKVKENLHAAGVRFVDSGRPVFKVAVGGGSCGDLLHAAYEKGCDVLVTADVKYDVFLEAKALGMSLIDAGHFPTENVVLPALCQLVKEHCPDVEVLESKVHKEVFSCL